MLKRFSYQARAAGVHLSTGTTGIVRIAAGIRLGLLAFATLRVTLTGVPAIRLANEKHRLALFVLNREILVAVGPAALCLSKGFTLVTDLVT